MSQPTATRWPPRRLPTERVLTAAELLRGEGSKGNIKMRVFVITITLSRLSGIVAKLEMARAAAA
jgi:hypothetical protein